MQHWGYCLSNHLTCFPALATDDDSCIAIETFANYLSVILASEFPFVPLIHWGYIHTYGSCQLMLIACVVCMQWSAVQHSEDTWHCASVYIDNGGDTHEVGCVHSIMEDILTCQYDCDINTDQSPQLQSPVMWSLWDTLLFQVKLEGVKKLCCYGYKLVHHNYGWNMYFANVLRLCNLYFTACIFILAVMLYWFECPKPAGFGVGEDGRICSSEWGNEIISCS